MMKRFLAAAAAAWMVAAIVPATAGPSPSAGVRSVALPAPEGAPPLEIAIWYPTSSDEVPEPIGENGVFRGAPGVWNAPAASGRHPLILLSHGGMRSAADLGGWIASRMAARGFIVISVHPKRSGGTRWILEEIWRRPARLSAALTALAEDPYWAPLIDRERIGVLGFQLGGTAALALAGARLDPESYVRSCEPGGTNMDCGWFAEAGVDLRRADLAEVGRSRRDHRIAAAVVVDPEFASIIVPASLADIAIPVRIINLGGPDGRAPGLDAVVLAGSDRRLRYDILPGATTFDAFNECKPAAAAILRAEGESEHLCANGSGRTRAGVHEDLAAMIEAAFRHDTPARSNAAR